MIRMVSSSFRSTCAASQNRKRHSGTREIPLLRTESVTQRPVKSPPTAPRRLHEPRGRGEARNCSARGVLGISWGSEPPLRGFCSQFQPAPLLSPWPSDSPPCRKLPRFRRSRLKGGEAAALKAASPLRSVLPGPRQLLEHPINARCLAHHRTPSPKPPQFTAGHLGVGSKRLWERL